MTEVCLTILATPEIEEKLLDQILVSDLAATFASQPAASHGGHLGRLDEAEQVLGRAEAVMVTAVLDVASADALLVLLRERFTGAGLRYWLTPVIERGQL